jgi:ubiquitin-protein ligase
MSTIEEKTQAINISYIARRIKRELLDMKKIGILCHDSDVTITQNYEKKFNVVFKNNKDGRLYKFIISYNYPFSPPKLELNCKPYYSYFKFRSEKFREFFYKCKGQRCFCCETRLCDNNWGPHITLTNIIDEVCLFHKECREIADIVIINVIKRKYLIDDINILEWIY